MFWAERSTKLAGIALLVLAAAVIVDAVLETAVVGEANALARADIEGMLVDINDNESLHYIGGGFAVVADSIALLSVAALLYLLFRERSQVLSLFFLAGTLAGAVCFMIADAASISLGLLAADFVEKGGPGGVAAGDASTLQVARATAAILTVADFVGLTILSLSFLSLGSILAWAPAAETNPPRWIGGLLSASSVFLLLTWLFLANEDVGFALSGIGIVGSLLSIIILAGWLLVRSEQQPRTSGARHAAANA